MTRRQFTRRQLLAGAAGAGGVGAVIGTGSVALFGDEELFPGNELVAEALDLLVEWEGDGESGSSEGEVPVTIDDPEGAVTLTASLPGRTNNPAYAWLRTTCPELPALAGDLDVTLSYANCGDGDGVIAEGTLLEVANDLRTGIPLSPTCNTGVRPGGQACLTTAETLDLTFEWELTDPYNDGPGRLFAFQFVGRQCRHNDGDRTPFRGDVTECEAPDPEGTGISYVEIYAGTGSCDRIGKLELESRGCYDQQGIEESYVGPGTYTLHDDIDGGDDGTCDGTGYRIRVTDTETKDGGTETTAIAFDLIDPDGQDPDLCKVVVKGGASTVTYDGGDLDGNSTDGLLAAPTNGGGRS